MATALDTNRDLEILEQTLIEEANAHVDGPEFARFLSIPFTLARARHEMIQRYYYVLNRRDCWGYVQANAPFTVKKIVWGHEQDELQGIPEQSGLDHVSLGMKEGGAVGLKPADYLASQPSHGTLTCMHAWLGLAQQAPWLEAFAASSSLELSNNNAILRNGGTSTRTATKYARDLDIPLKKLPSKAEHIEVDVGHASILMDVARKYGTTAEARAQILNGARKSFAIQATYFGMLSLSMEAIAE